MSDSTPVLEDPDFEYFNMGAATKARCKHCGAVMDPMETDGHKRPAKPK